MRDWGGRWVGREMGLREGMGLGMEMGLGSEMGWERDEIVEGRGFGEGYGSWGN